MSKKYNKRRNRNNPFKCGGYSTAQSYKDKIAYKNNQIQLKMKAENIRNMLAKNDAHNETSLPIQPNDKLTLYVFSVGKELPYNLGKLPVDFALMDMLPDPTFVLSMSNIKAVELKQFEHDRPIEFRVLWGTGKHKLYSIILCKFNNLVQEFNFNPNLCKKAVLNYMHNDSNIFKVVVLEGTTKIIKALRILGFDYETKTNLYAIWTKMLSQDIPEEEYEKWYKDHWKYTTEQLWNMATPIGKWVSVC